MMAVTTQQRTVSETLDQHEHKAGVANVLEKDQIEQVYTGPYAEEELDEEDELDEDDEEDDDEEDDDDAEIEEDDELDEEVEVARVADADRS